MIASGDRWPSPARAWLAVAILNLAYTFSFIDRTLLDLLVVPIERDLGFGDARAGWLLGPAFGLFYTIFSLPLGRLSDRSNRRWIITGGIMLWSLMTALCGAAGNFWQLLLARMGVGIGEASLNPAALSLIADYFPPHRRALATSVYVNAGSVGSGLAFLGGGALVALVSDRGTSHLPILGSIAAWQAIFILVGASGLIVVLAILTVREPPRRKDAGGGAADPTIDRPSWRELGRFLKLRRKLLLLHFGGFGAFSLLVYALLKWAPTFLVRRFGMPVAEVGHDFGILFLIFGPAGVLSGGWLAGRLKHRFAHDATLRVVVIGLVGIIPSAVVTALMTTPSAALLAFGVTIFFIAFPSGVSVAAVQEITPNRLRAQVIALYYLSINMLGYLGPLVTALLTQYVFADPTRVGWSISLAALIFGPLAAISVAMALKPFRLAVSDDAGLQCLSPANALPRR